MRFLKSLRHSRGVASLVVVFLLLWNLGAAARFCAADADDPPVVTTKLYPHLFAYDPRGASPRRVMVAGDFNGWSLDANPMSPRPDGTFAASVRMTEGVHQYKFVVDGKWVKDPASDRQLEESDGNGGNNCAVVIGPDARNIPPPTPGK